MSKTVAVLVVQPLTHQGRSYVRGDRVEVSATQALAYRRQGKVTLTRGVTIEKAPEPEPKTRRRTVRASTTRRRQTYQTRDMIADPIE